MSDDTVITPARATLSAGILGGGFMAQVHSRALRAEGVRLLSIASSTPSKSALAAAALGIEEAVTGAASLLSDKRVEVVHICTPNDVHAAQSIAAIEAGKHIICEKPIATQLTDALRVVQAQESAGLVGTVPFVYRYHPMVREARARILANRSVVLSVDAAYMQDWLLDREDSNWRAGESGGASRAFSDIGSHVFDLIEFVTGERVKRVVAIARTVFPERGGMPVDNEDIAGVLFELAGGAPGCALITQMAAGRKNGLTLEIHTGDAAYRFEQEHPDQLWIGRRDGSILLPREERLLSNDAARLNRVPAGHPMGYQDAFNAFIADSYAAIAGEKPEGLPSLRDGLRAVQLTDAVLESARTQSWIDTPVLNQAGELS
ncbi:Gfo/Idh/MocA family protein [Microbacterium sp. bgisy207]|uniref:Gfo/Idh/MocA family protein n=1 Tax=Microbacterium sp. bgisy207 TaxID=3413800 RepID=UPI003EBA3ADE